MFTSKILQVPKKYENLDQVPWTSQKIDNTENASTKKEAETKPPMDFTALIAKKNDIFKKENDDKTKTGYSYTEINDAVKNYMTIWYIPNEAPKNNLLNLKPTNLWSAVPVAPETATPVVEAPKKTEHIVQKWDTLWRIALDNKMSLAVLLQLNKNISNPDSIKIGDKINLTSSESVASTDKLKKQAAEAANVIEKKRIAEAQAKVVAEEAKRLEEKLKTPKGQLEVAKARLAKAESLIASATKQNGNMITAVPMKNQAETDIKRLEKEVAKLNEEERKEKEYNVLSPNQKILADYNEALKKVKENIQILAKDNIWWKNQQKIDNLWKQASEINSMIKTSESLIKNDKEIADLNNYNTYLKNNWPDWTQTKNIENTTKEIEKLKINNNQLVASLNASKNLNPTMVAEARKQNNSSNIG